MRNVLSETLRSRFRIERDALIFGLRLRSGPPDSIFYILDDGRGDIHHRSSPIQGII